MPQLSSRTLANLVQTLLRFHEEIAAYTNSFGALPTATSPIGREIEHFPRQESVNTAVGQANILVEAAADNLMAISRVLVEPIQSIAPWTLVRAVLESSALAGWILDPTADVRERVGRSFAFRFEGLTQQVKLARATNGLLDPVGVERRIDEVEAVAASLGYPRIAKNGRRTGIGKNMPSTTDLVRDVLEDEIAYRLLSAVAHAHLWALHQLSFRRADELADTRAEHGPFEVDTTFLAKHLGLESAIYICQTVFLAFSRALCRQTLLYGWDATALSEILERAGDGLGVANEKRHWRVQFPVVN